MYCAFVLQKLKELLHSTQSSFNVLLKDSCARKKKKQKKKKQPSPLIRGITVM